MNTTKCCHIQNSNKMIFLPRKNLDFLEHTYNKDVLWHSIKYSSDCKNIVQSLKTR